MVDSATMLGLRWDESLTRGPENVPLLSPWFVAEQGPGVQIADIRPPEEATGVLGYIPGSVFAPVERLEEMARSGVSTPLVLVSGTGRRAAAAARRLEALGIENVAAMVGGLAAWRERGLSTSRNPEGIRRDFAPIPRVVHESTTFTLDRVRQHVGDPRSVRWIKLGSLIAQTQISCIDGRDERGVIGSPGGDGGEFLVTLAAIEATTGRALDEREIHNGLISHLDTFGHFYMHSDMLAFELLTRALGADPELETSHLAHTKEWFEFLRGPSPDLRERFLEHLLDPAHIGCGHIRLMLEHSEEYGVREGLVKLFLRSFYQLWWEGSPEVSLRILPGEHAEGAVVNVRLAEPLWGLSRIPLVSPSSRGQQMFINHPDVSSYLRRKAVQFHLRGGNSLGLDSSLVVRLQEAADVLADRQLGVTVGRLAEGLPIYEVVFAEDGSFEVNG